MTVNRKLEQSVDQQWRAIHSKAAAAKASMLANPGPEAQGTAVSDATDGMIRAWGRQARERMQEAMKRDN